MNKTKTLLELDLVLPEAGIDGLYFNETKVKAFFEQKEAGCYYSRYILFLSARQHPDVLDDTLTEYIESYAFRNAIFDSLPLDLKPAAGYDIETFIPRENQGIKQYNGVNCSYWLKDRRGEDSDDFLCVSESGYIATLFDGTSIAGCAPAFRVVPEKNQ